MADPSKHNSPRRLIIILSLLFLLLLGGAYITYYFIQSSPKEVTVVPKIKTEITKDQIKTGEKRIKKAKKRKAKAKKTEEQEISLDEKKLKADEKKLKTDEEKLKTEEKEISLDEKKLKSKEKKQVIATGRELDLTDPLNQMPARAKQIQSAFAPTAKNIITVNEISFDTLQSEAFFGAGKSNPFVGADTIASAEKISEGKLPEVSMPPINFGAPQGLKGIKDLFVEGPPPKYVPKSLITKTTADSETLDSTVLTGVVGKSAILNFNGYSRALQAGQNYRGIVVLSVNPSNVTLELNGYTVTKTLKN